MEKRNAAKMIIQKEFTPEEFVKSVLEFKNNQDKIFELEKNIQKIYIPNAAQNIAKFILGSIEKNNATATQKGTP